ncbi:MAG TPA: metal-dependent transcriptional regulator [Candidatus Rifleibacterium sp.]|nr:metal-dependent transcriptional regulator [Candidatus Rifleibacterium sp.]HPT46563.1 metal-dependent transcriptional regulator [Candidatus Rifleibacterium sp.]
MKKRVSGALESYLEQIAELQRQFGSVRTSDLAERMGCRRSSVTSALQRLAESGLINYQAYRPVTLTPEGENTIRALNRFHRTLAKFLGEILAFPEEFAQQEACRLEHRVSAATIERMQAYLDFENIRVCEHNISGKPCNKISRSREAFTKFLGER